MSESDTPIDEKAEEIRDAFDELEDQTTDEGGEAPPDPSELEPITKDEAEYKRDADGNLKPSEHAVQYNGEWRRVSVRPLLPTDQADLEKKFKGRSDIDFEELYDLLDKHIAEPEDVDWDVARPGVMMPCIMALMKEFVGGAEDAFYDEVERELEERADESDEGN